MKQFLLTEIQINKLINDAWNAGEAYGSGFPTDSFHNFYEGTVQPVLNKAPKAHLEK